MNTQSNVTETSSTDLQVKEKQQAATKETGTREGSYFEPQVDIFETADALTLTADLPGAEPGEVVTDLKDSLLTIQVNVKPVESKWKPLYQEYEVGHYLRQFRLGQHIDQGGITAKLKDGVLTLTLPKSEAVKPRRVEIVSG